jgi:hypothetical protein
MQAACVALARCATVAGLASLAGCLLAGAGVGQQSAPVSQNGANTSTRGLQPEDAARLEMGQLKGRYFALVIGIDDYRTLPHLQTAVGDAQTIAKILGSGYGFQVKLLLNPTRDQIMGALNAFRRELDANSNLLIYYAGHGYHDKDVDKFYWLPVDAQSNDNTNWIIADDVTSDIKGIAAQHVLVVSDSCYSGTMRAADVSFAPQDRQHLLEKMMAGHSRDLLASGQDEPVSDSGGSGHSVFAAALIRGLTTEPEKVFTGDDLFENYIRLQVGGSAAQTPDYGPLHNSGHVAGDFVFVRNGASLPLALPSVLPGTPNESARSTLSASAPPIELGPRPAPPEFGAAAVKNAIASLDVDALTRMTAAGVRPAVVEQAFRQLADDRKTTVAQQFFEGTLDSPAAIAWLDSALAAGMDPNLTVPSSYFEHEAILAVAMRAGNVAATKVLLHRGASPHAYEDLFLTRFSAPRFLFPLDGVIGDDRFSMADKQDLTKAFLDAGAIVPEVSPPAMEMGSEMVEAADLQKDYATKLGMKLTPSPPCCKQPSPICKSASARTGTDWCAIVAAMPGELVFASTLGATSPFYNLSLQYLLTIANNDAYFLGRIEYPNKAFSPDYVLVSITRDASSWTVYKFMAPEAGMGLCKKDADDSNDTPRPDYCWRRIPLYRVAGTDQLRSDLFSITWRIASKP